MAPSARSSPTGGGGDGNTTLGRLTHPLFPCWEGCGRHLLPASSFPAALPTGARVCSGHLLPLRAERVDSQTTQNQESRGLIQTIAGQVHLGTRDPCRFHATASWVCLLRSTIKLLSSLLLLLLYIFLIVVLLYISFGAYFLCLLGIYCLLELNMLCDCVTRGCGDHSPLTTAAILEWRRRSAWGGAAAARRGLRGLGPDRPGIAGRCSPVGSRTGDPPAHAR